MPQLCFLYKLNYPSVDTMSERQRAAAHMQGTVFTLARLKIVPIFKNCTTSNASQCVEKLSCLV